MVKRLKKLKILDLFTLTDEVFFSIYGEHIDDSRFELVRAGPDASEEEICKLVQDADILLTDSRHRTHVTRKIIESGKNLKLIQCHTIGFDDVDTEAARELGIPVANSAGITAKPMAEYTIMAASYLIKSIEYANSEVNKGNWVQEQLLGPPHMPLEFGSLTLGIIGCGSIGREVARLAGVFGTRILYHNRNRLSDETEKALGLEYSSFEDILRSSDVLSINVPFTDETRGMIGADEISLMKKGAVLINTARGGIVDEHALADALRSGHLRGAAVDVFENESIVSSCPLLGIDNVILTPHSSGISPDMFKRIPVKVMENLNRVYEGKPPLRVVN